MQAYKKRKLSDNEYVRIEHDLTSIKIVINKTNMNYFSSQSFIGELKDAIHNKISEKHEVDYFSLWLDTFDLLWLDTHDLKIENNTHTFKFNYFRTQSFLNELKDYIHFKEIKKIRNMYTDKLVKNTKTLKDKIKNLLEMNQQNKMIFSTLKQNYERSKKDNMNLQEEINNMKNEKLTAFKNLKQNLIDDLSKYVEDRHKGYGHHDDVYPTWVVHWRVRELNLISNQINTQTK